MTRLRRHDQLQVIADCDGSGETGRQRATGRITVVQEGRFLLVTDRGRGLLLTLAEDADGSVDALQRYRDTGTRVAADYEGEPDLAGGVARAVRPL